MNPSYLYNLLDSEKSADVLVELPEDEREQFIEEMPGEMIARKVIDNMESDDAADLLSELVRRKSRKRYCRILRMWNRQGILQIC